MNLKNFLLLTVCPKCAKIYGLNYAVAFAQIEWYNFIRYKKVKLITNIGSNPYLGFKKLTLSVDEYELLLLF